MGFRATNTTGSSVSVTAIKWKWPLVGATANVLCPLSVLRADGEEWFGKGASECLGLCGSAAAQSRLSCSTQQQQQRHSSAPVTLWSLLLRFNPLKLELTARPPLLRNSWVLGIWEPQWMEAAGAEQSAELPQNLGGWWHPELEGSCSRFVP